MRELFVSRNPIPMRLILGLFGVSLLALAGCGGGGNSSSGGSSDTPAGTVKAFYDAAGSGDGGTACGLFSSDPGDSGNLLAAPAGALPSLSSTCVKKVADVNSSNPGLLAKTADALSVKTAKESGNQATVDLTIPGAPFKYVVVLEKSGGGWKIDQAGNAQFFK
jgi:hypothetical protein